MRIALYQPDIPQNAGAIFRLAACLGIAVDVIEPCGFVLDDRRLRTGRNGLWRTGRETVRHPSWKTYTGRHSDTDRRADGDAIGRIVLLTTSGATPYTEFTFEASGHTIAGTRKCRRAGQCSHSCRCATDCPDGRWRAVT